MITMIPEEDEDLNSLNQGLVLIAKPFNKLSKSNNRLRSSSNTRNIKQLFKMDVLKYKIVIMVNLVQVVMWEIMEMEKGLTIMEDTGTTLVLHRRKFKSLKLGTPSLGIQ